MIRALSVGLLLVLALSSCATSPAPPLVTGAHDARAFAQLSHAIEGQWITEGGTRAGYALVSSDTALVETWIAASGAQTLTVYHPDGDEVLLTHYCAQGNQATLRLTAVDGAHFRFERERVTNRLPGQGVLTVLELAIEGEALARTETYVDDAGTPEVTTIRFARVP